ncbi:hypothetical protein CYG49_01080 [Candidatus Saccharibacteria bacterium]|nr:MAG: hypothetical protein CYG49_01080 [Candidatus Saccharibacteria bacterium]
MSIICPSVTPTTSDPHEYRDQIERIAPFAQRIQIDLMDGQFAPTRSLNPVQVWWPEGIIADIHLMFQRPIEHIETLVSLRPNLVIIHAEAEGDLLGILEHLKACGLKAGVCLLQTTQPESVRELIAAADHVLIFSGSLGRFGGTVDESQLAKIPAIKMINPNAEIGWDGGANADNVALLAKHGVDVINVGGAIQKASDPDVAYATLVSSIS